MCVHENGAATNENEINYSHFVCIVQINDKLAVLHADFKRRSVEQVSDCHEVFIAARIDGWMAAFVCERSENFSFFD